MHKKNFKKLSPREKVLSAAILILVAALVAVTVFGGALPELLNGDRTLPQKYYTSFYSRGSNIQLPPEFNTAELLEVHFIDVGQGDAIFIRLPDGKDMLIDCGSGVKASKDVRDAFSDYLNDLDIGVLDYMIITHPDSDHVNLAGIVLSYFEVRNIYYNDLYEGQSNTYREFVDLAAAEDAELFRIDGAGGRYAVSGDGYDIDVIAPGHSRFGDANSMSVFCLLSYGGIRLLFTGDATAESEDYLITFLGEPLDIDILKVAHHGSQTGTTQSFLDFFTPEYAVISVSAVNTYNLPSPFVMNRLFHCGAVTYRTDRHGSIVLYIDDSGDFGFLPTKSLPPDNNSLLLDEKRLLLKPSD